MGATIVKAKSSVVQDSATNMQATCDVTQQTTQNIWERVSINNCPYLNLSITNDAKQKISCTLDQAASALQQALSSADSSVKNGILPTLGLSMSDSEATVNQKIRSYLSSKCNASGSITQLESGSINCTNSPHDVVSILNSADSVTQCYVKAVSQLGQGATAVSKASVTGTGWVIIVLIVVVVIVAIVVVVEVLKTKGLIGGKKNSGGQIYTSSSVTPSPTAATPTVQKTEPAVTGPVPVPAGQPTAVPVPVPVPAGQPTAVPIKSGGRYRGNHTFSHRIYH
jgi:hypothetical protein